MYKTMYFATATIFSLCNFLCYRTLTAIPSKDTFCLGIYNLIWETRIFAYFDTRKYESLWDAYILGIHLAYARSWVYPNM